MSKLFISEANAIYVKNKDSDRLAELIVNLAEKHYEHISSRASALGKYKKKLIDSLAGEIPKNVADIQLSRAMYGDIIQKQKQKLAAKGDDPVVFENTTKFIHSLLDGLLSDNASKLFAGIAMATGRRSSEITDTAILTAVEGKPYAARFKGQLKTKNKGKLYEIPLLAPFDTVSKALDKFRTLKISSRTISTHVTKMLPPKATVHTIRGLYAMYIFRVSKTKQSINRHIEAVLGHENPEVSVHYTCIKMNGVDPSIDPWAIKVKRTAAEQRVVDNINALKKLPPPQNKVTINKLRLLGSSYAVIKRVLESLAKK